MQLLETEEDMRVELAYEKMMAAWLLGFEVDISLSENGVNNHLWPLESTLVGNMDENGD